MPSINATKDVAFWLRTFTHANIVMPYRNSVRKRDPAYYRMSVIEEKRDDEKLYKRLTIGMFSMYTTTHNCRRAWVSMCAIRQLVNTSQPLTATPEFILVRLCLTMCNKPRVDCFVYDIKADDFSLWLGLNSLKNFVCDPAFIYNFEDIEAKYHVYIRQHGYWYDPSKGIKRSVDVNSTKGRPTGFVYGEELDEVDRLWEADDNDNASRYQIYVCSLFQNEFDTSIYTAITIIIWPLQLFSRHATPKVDDAYKRQKS